MINQSDTNNNDHSYRKSNCYYVRENKCGVNLTMIGFKRIFVDLNYRIDLQFPG